MALIASLYSFLAFLKDFQCEYILLLPARECRLLLLDLSLSKFLVHQAVKDFSFTFISGQFSSQSCNYFQIFLIGSFFWYLRQMLIHGSTL